MNWISIKDRIPELGQEVIVCGELTYRSKKSIVYCMAQLSSLGWNFITCPYPFSGQCIAVSKWCEISDD
jgi:hypothetical protein